MEPGVTPDPLEFSIHPIGTKGDTMERFWLKHYPPGVPADIDADQYSSLVLLMARTVAGGLLQCI